MRAGKQSLKDRKHDALKIGCDETSDPALPGFDGDGYLGLIQYFVVVVVQRLHRIRLPEVPG